jgi:hypothetical protein
VSQLITNTIQLGQDQTTDANNFVLTAPGDGSFSISAGVPGNTASPVFEVTTAGSVVVSNTTTSVVVANTLTAGDLTANTLTANTLTINDYTFPATDGNANQVLQTDGSGNVSFTDLPEGFTTGKAIAMAIVFG